MFSKKVNKLYLTNMLNWNIVIDSELQNDVVKHRVSTLFSFGKIVIFLIMCINKTALNRRRINICDMCF